MSDDPRSWLLIQAVLGRLRLIRQANGYRTDAGEAATDEPVQEDDRKADFLLMPILEATRRSQDPARNQRSARAATVAVVAMIKASRKDAQRVLHWILDDVDQVMKPTEESMKGFPPGVTYPRFTGSELLPRPEGSKWIGAVVRFETEFPL